MTATESGGQLSGKVKEQATDVGGAARAEAGAVAERTTQAAGDVVGTAREQAGEVAGEAARRARDLADEARAQAREQADAQRDRAVSTLQSFADELRSMAQSSGQQGLASELAEQAAQRAERLAGYLDGREPGTLIEDVREFARRRPGAFLAGAAVAGVVVGRITRGIKDKGSAESERQPAVRAGTPVGYLEPPTTTTGYVPGAPTMEPLATEDPRRIPGV